MVERILASKCEVVKLGVDVHARDVVVAVQLDGAQAQRAQKLSAEQLVGMAGRLVHAGRRVYVCQESEAPGGPERSRRAAEPDPELPMRLTGRFALSLCLRIRCARTLI